MIIKHFTYFLTIVAILSFQTSFEASAAVYKTENFVVHTEDPELARQFALTAEYQRRKQAIDWLGAPLDNWSSPCQVKVKVGDKLAPGGATTFVFCRGEVYDWDMNIQGSAERIIDSVIPHEVTHMIFACRFRQPVPRWVDEGAATSVEHISERLKYRNMLIEFLQTNRGIAFRTMVNTKEYPQDAMPFYAQSYTAAEFLIGRGGRQRYIAFVDMGIKTNNWNEALRHYYGYNSLAQFQDVWLAWVDARFPSLENDLTPDRTLVAAAYTQSSPSANDQNGRTARPEPNLLLRTPVSTAHPNMTASYNTTPVVQTGTAIPAPIPRNPTIIQTGAVISDPIPQPEGAWNEIAPASYNEIAPSSEVQSPRAKLNWLPGDTLPLYSDTDNIQR